MTIRITVPAITAIAIGLGGCGPVKPPVVENSNYLKITGIDFRKTGAINTDILYAGVKKSLGVNTFDPKFRPVMEKEITARQVIEVFNVQTSKAAIEAAAKAGIDIADANVGGSTSGISEASGKYSVFILFDSHDFVAELNSPKNRKNIEMLMRYDDPRIITSIATVFSRTSSTKMSTSGSLSLKIKNPEFGSPEFLIKAENSGNTVAKLSDGAIFAYEYARICWEKKDEKIQIASIEVDRPGIDDDCPAGTKDSASKL